MSTVRSPSAVIGPGVFRFEAKRYHRRWRSSGLTGRRRHGGYDFTRADGQPFGRILAIDLMTVRRGVRLFGFLTPDGFIRVAVTSTKTGKTTRRDVDFWIGLTVAP